MSPPPQSELHPLQGTTFHTPRPFSSSAQLMGIGVFWGLGVVTQVSDVSHQKHKYFIYYTFDRRYSLECNL